MPVTTAIVAGTVAKGVYDTVKAGRERKKALRQLQEHPYQVPQSQIAAVNKAATLAQGTKLAGQDIMETNIASRTGEGVGAVKRAAQTPSQVLASTIDLYKQQQQQQEQLDLTAASDYRVRQQGYISSLTTLSPYLQEKQKWDTQYPVEARLNYAGGLDASGQQNIATGIGAAANLYANQQYLNGLGGQGSTTPSATVPTPTAQPFDYWGGGMPNTSIQKRQGNY